MIYITKLGSLARLKTTPELDTVATPPPPRRRPAKTNSTYSDNKTLPASPCRPKTFQFSSRAAAGDLGRQAARSLARIYQQGARANNITPGSPASFAVSRGATRASDHLIMQSSRHCVWFVDSTNSNKSCRCTSVLVVLVPSRRDELAGLRKAAAAACGAHLSMSWNVTPANETSAASGLHRPTAALQVHVFSLSAGTRAALAGAGRHAPSRCRAEPARRPPGTWRELGRADLIESAASVGATAHRPLFVAADWSQATAAAS
jgi:hypothetical protein